MVERSDRMWSTGEYNGKPLQYSCLEQPTNSMKRQKDRTLKDELLRLVGAQYAIQDQWRNKSRKNERIEPKKNNTQLWMGLMTEARSDAVKSSIAIGTWNVRSMNQGELEMARVNVNILGIRKLKWTGMGEFNSNDNYIYYCGGNPLEEME